jgi:hypothetical protein
MIQSLILLVFDDTDLAALNLAAAFAKSLAVENLWVLHNPQLGLSGSPQDAELAFRIEELGVAERQAAARRDYTSAAQYRDQANGLEVERGLAIKQGYKSIPPTELQAAYDKAFEAITQESTGAKNILIEAIPDPLNKNQAFQFLQSQATSNWIDQIHHGEYLVVWAGAIHGQLPAQVETDPTADVTDEKSDITAFGLIPGQEYSIEALKTMDVELVREYAKTKGVQDVHKKNKWQVIKALQNLAAVESL